MSQVIALALLGAGLYAGYRWFARTLAWWRTTKQRVRDALAQWPAWQAARRTWRRAALWVRRRVRSAR